MNAICGARGSVDTEQAPHFLDVSAHACVPVSDLSACRSGTLASARRNGNRHVATDGRTAGLGLSGTPRIPASARPAYVIRRCQPNGRVRRTSQFNHGPSNDRNRRDLAVGGDAAGGPILDLKPQFKLIQRRALVGWLGPAIHVFLPWRPPIKTWTPGSSPG